MKSIIKTIFCGMAFLLSGAAFAASTLIVNDASAAYIMQVSYQTCIYDNGSPKCTDIIQSQLAPKNPLKIELTDQQFVNVTEAVMTDSFGRIIARSEYKDYRCDPKPDRIAILNNYHSDRIACQVSPAK